MAQTENIPPAGAPPRPHCGVCREQPPPPWPACAVQTNITYLPGDEQTGRGFGPPDGVNNTNYLLVVWWLRHCLTRCPRVRERGDPFQRP